MIKVVFTYRTTKENLPELMFRHFSSQVGSIPNKKERVQ